MEQHRADPACAGCHKMMDPIGLGLENFDAVGLWRAKDSGVPVDASGQMYDGAKLNGPISVRTAVLSHSDAYVRNFAANLLSYGLGRVIESRDMPAVRGVEREAAKSNNHFSAFVMGVVKSVPFQMRTAEAAAPSEEVVPAERR